MKIIYIEDTITCMNRILEEIDCQNFFEENKLVLLSRYPYVVQPYCTHSHLDVYQKLKSYSENGSIMHIALGNLSYILYGNEIKIQNHGPGFHEQDLVDFPIRYYQERENQSVDSISFHYSTSYSSPYFNIDKLNNYLKRIGVKNSKLLDFQNIDLVYKEENRIIDTKPRKVIFVSAEEIFYGFNADVGNIENIVKEYLNNGNFLVLLTYTGNHYGYPFSTDVANILDTSSHINEYRQLLNFFRSLDISDDQVSNFKVTYTGLNFRGNSYNFGFSFDNINQFFEIYLNYLKNKGYNIEKVYLLDRCKNSHISQMVESLTDSYIIDYLSSQGEFNKVVKEKIIK